MKVVSLFSGCGGLDYGLHQAGHEIILQCENDPGAQQVLKAAFPGTLLAPDIVALSALPPETELLAAGFPCIDVSRAGLRRGLDGPSTGLVRHVFRLLERAAADHRPVPWVLLENVEALLDRRQDGPPVVAWLAQRFEKLGYKSWAHRVVCSAGFGVPNRRKRVFMVASMHGDARDVLLAQGAHRCMGGCLASVGADCWECFDPDDLKDGAKSALSGCSYALDLGNARSAAGVDVVPTFTTSNDRMCLLLSSGRYGLMRIDDAERLQGLPIGHTLACHPLKTYGGGGGCDAPLSRGEERETREHERRRFQLLGNAVTTQVARWIGERLASPYRFKYLPTDADAPLPEQFQAEGMDQTALDAVSELRLDRRLGSGAVSGQGLLHRRPSVHTPSAAAAAGGAGGSGGGAAAGGNDGSSADDGTPGPADPSCGVGGGSDAPAARGVTDGVTGAGDAECVGDEDDEDEAVTVPFDALTGNLRRSGRVKASTAARRVERYQTAASLFEAAWPKAAWYVEGQGRWGVGEMSECPLKVAFVPLGDFIQEVGGRPPDVSIITYLQRLKEQGWDVTRTERKLMMCGGDVAAAILDVLGKGDVPMEHAASIGHLAWATEKPLNPQWAPDKNPNTTPPTTTTTATAATAATAVTAAAVTEGASTPAAAAAAAGGDTDGGSAAGAGAAAAQQPWPMLGVHLSSSRRNAAGPWWPCEVVDPFAPPLGFLFLLDHMTALDEHERRAYVPAGVARGVADCAVWSAADAASFGPPPPGHRKLLVLWLGLGKFEWRFDWELLPFEPFLEEMEGQAKRLEESGRLPRRQQFFRGLQDAKEALALQHGFMDRAAGGTSTAGDTALAAALAAASRGGGETLRDAAASRAARQANAANSLPRCQVCEACTQCTGATHRRRCLMMRAAAAAAGGHAGAQLAVLGDGAVGARVSVWWPIDGAWFGGVITAYDRLRVRHTVDYDDGDVEILPLWGPQQRIRLTSRPDQWADEAAKLAARREERERRVAAARARQAEANVLLAGAPTTALEAQRAANIARNNEKLAALGLFAKNTDAVTAAGGPTDGAGTPADAALARGSGAGGAAGAAAGGAAAAAGGDSRKRGRPKKGPGPRGGGGGAGEGSAGEEGAAAAAGGRGRSRSASPGAAAAGAASAQGDASGSGAVATAAAAAADQSAAAAKRQKTAAAAGGAGPSAGLPPRPPSGRTATGRPGRAVGGK